MPMVTVYVELETLQLGERLGVKMEQEKMEHFNKGKQSSDLD